MSAHHRKILAGTAAALTWTAAMAAATPGLAWGSPGRTVILHPGDSVQAALDAAAPGSTLVLERGSYPGNLAITKTVRLRSHGPVVIEPAPTFRHNACTDEPEATGPDGQVQVTGICIGQIGPGETILHTVVGVTLVGLRIRGFSAAGMFAAGTSGLTVREVELDHNGDYGALADLSDHVTFSSNRVHDNGNGGLHLSADDVVTATNNRSYRNNAEGIFLGDSTGGEVHDNSLSGNCIGLLAIESGFPGAARDLHITGNTINANNRYCPAQSGPTGRPAEGGLGLALAGTSDTVIAGNSITGNVLASVPSGSEPPFVQGGLALLDTTGFGGSVPTNNRITGNRLEANAPLDVTTDGTGSGNVFHGNDCETANQPDICR